MVTEANVHLSLDTEDYNRLVAHFQGLGAKVEITKSKQGEPLVTTVDVRLFLNAADNRPYANVAIHDRTYSHNIFRLEGKPDMRHHPEG